MSYMLSRHVEQRMNQRGIRATDLDLILALGQQVAPDAYLMTDAVIDQEIARCRHDKPRVQQLERLRGKKVIVSGPTIVTVYHACENDLRRSFRRGSKRRQPRYGRAPSSTGRL